MRLSNIAFPKEARDIIEEIFPVKDDLTKLMKEDMERFLRRLKRPASIPT